MDKIFELEAQKKVFKKDNKVPTIGKPVINYCLINEIKYLIIEVVQESDMELVYENDEFNTYFEQSQNEDIHLRFIAGGKQVKKQTLNPHQLYLRKEFKAFTTIHSNNLKQAGSAQEDIKAFEIKSNAFIHKMEKARILSLAGAQYGWGSDYYKKELKEDFPYYTNTIDAKAKFLKKKMHDQIAIFHTNIANAQKKITASISICDSNLEASNSLIKEASLQVLEAQSKKDCAEETLNEFGKDKKKEILPGYDLIITELNQFVSSVEQSLVHIGQDKQAQKTLLSKIESQNVILNLFESKVLVSNDILSIISLENTVFKKLILQVGNAINESTVFTASIPIDLGLQAGKINNISGKANALDAKVDAVKAPEIKRRKDLADKVKKGQTKLEKEKKDSKSGSGAGFRVSFARTMAKIIIKKETDKKLTTGTSFEALEFMDSFEFVSRVMVSDGLVTKSVSGTEGLKTIFADKTKFVYSKTPRVGDIALWEGHAGIVTSADGEGFRMIHASESKESIYENNGHITAKQYEKSKKFIGFYKPKVEVDAEKARAKKTTKLKKENNTETNLPSASEANTAASNIKLLIDEWKRLGDGNNKKLAYILATAEWESGFRAQEEHRGKTLSTAQKKYWNTGFYGRGFVQLTWKGNYEKMTSVIGKDLVKNPELALVPSNAAKITISGMINGSFSGVGLGKYFDDGKSKWNKARAIINGTDKAAKIAEIAKKHYKILEGDHADKTYKNWINWFDRQTVLKHEGFLKGKVDGMYGGDSSQAMKKFIKKYKLPATVDDSGTNDKSDEKLLEILRVLTATPEKINHKELIKEQYQKYKDDEIDMIALGKKLIPFAKNFGDNIVDIIDDLGWGDGDNLAYVIVNYSTVEQLQSYSFKLLVELAEQLDPDNNYSEVAAKKKMYTKLSTACWDKLAEHFGWIKELVGDKEKESDNVKAALKFMEEYLGNEYKQQYQGLRTEMTDEAIEYMDCSEFVCRFLKQTGDLDKVPLINTAGFLKYIDPKKESKYFSYVDGSKSKSHKDIRPGDFFVWSRSSTDGHTGVVTKYDKVKDQVHIIEAIGKYGAAEERLSKGLEGYGKLKVRNSIYSRTGKALYSHAGWEGYFRPK